MDLQKLLKRMREAGTQAFVSSTPAFGVLDALRAKPQTTTGRIARGVGTQAASTMREAVPAVIRQAPPAIGFNASRQKPMQQLMDATRIAKAGSMAYGLPRMTIGSTLATAGLSGGFNKVMGGSFEQGATQGLATAPQISGITRMTGPLIRAASMKIAPTRELGARFATGALNVPEGALIDASFDRRPFSLGSAAVDFATGFATGRTGIGTRIQDMRPQKNLKSPSQGPILRDTDAKQVSQLLRKSVDRALSVDDVHEVRTLARQHLKLPKTELQKMEVPEMLSQLESLLDRNQRYAMLDLPGSDASSAMGFAASGPRIAKQDTVGYVHNQVVKQRSAQGKETVLTKLKGLRGDIKRKFVDETAAIEDILNSVEKTGKVRIVPQKDIRYQIDKAIRADTLATQFVKDQGLDQVIKKVPDLDVFNQYLIAKQALRVGEKGIKTGRDTYMDRKLVQDIGGQYEPFAQQIKAYNDALLDYKVQAGFISQELADALRREYPDYVPLKRVFSEIEEQAARAGSGKGGPASIGTQNVLKRLKGSEREIVNPLESIMEATAVAFREGERNKAAQMLVAYEQLPGNPFGLRRLGKGEATANKHTVSAFVNGEKVTYETLPEVAEAAKNMNPQQFGLLGQIFAIPTRVLRLGAVGVNLPFVAANLVRDQLTASVISQKAMKTSLANPLNFGRALYEAIGHGKLYDDWIRSGSSFTQFDIGRNQTAPTIAKLRSGRSVPSKVAYTAKNPGELLRALENVIGRSEEVTRLQQFGGTRDAFLQQGRTAGDAELLAGAASRYNTANFGRKGSWAKVVNGAIPFFSAGIAGARSFVRAAAQDPAGTAVRFTATVGIPTATVTAWNLADPERKAAYDDIPDYEKENSLIILPPSPTRDKDGNWNAIKIPMTPGLSNLAAIVRRQVEGMHGVDNGSAGQILAQTIGDVTTATTSLNVSNPRQMVTQFTPQLVKPGIETTLNKNLFTGQDIVPSYMENLPPEEQVKDTTSGTARIIGGLTNQSPLLVENAVGTTLAGTGRQLLNLSDRGLANARLIPEEQVGGRSLSEDVRGRFLVARGGQKTNELYEDLDKQQGETQQRNNKIKAAYQEGDTKTFESMTKGMSKQQISSLMSSAEERAVRDDLTPQQKAIQSYSADQREALRLSRPDLAADIDLVESAGGSGTVKVGNILRYTDGDERKTIYFDDYDTSKLSGLKKHEVEREKFSVARKLYSADGLSDQQKADAFKQLGFKPEDVEYDYLANQENSIKSAYLIEEFGSADHDELIETLAELRRPSISDKIAASDGVLDELYDQGLISYAERKMLKDMDLDRAGKPKVSKRRGGKGRKLAEPGRIKSVAIGKPQTSRIVTALPKSRRGARITMPNITTPPLTIRNKRSTIKGSRTRPRAITVRKTTVRFGR